MFLSLARFKLSSKFTYGRKKLQNIPTLDEHPRGTFRRWGFACSTYILNGHSVGDRNLCNVIPSCEINYSNKRHDESGFGPTGLCTYYIAYISKVKIMNLVANFLPLFFSLLLKL